MSNAPKEGSRPYRMRQRAERIEETRLRIVEAAVTLHGTVGPAGTTVTGLAHQAGVTRATVYRHFPDETALFAACSAHWLAGQVPPDPSSWSDVADPVARVRAGLADLYRFYRVGEPMLTRIYRDKASLPEDQRRGLDARDAHIHNLLLARFPKRQRDSRRLRAVVAHAVAFWTWRSLGIDNGLTDEEAVDLMVALTVTACAAGRGRPIH